ncbi:MAG: glycosyltransferase [Gemmatimonadota bacterium]
MFTLAVACAVAVVGIWFGYPLVIAALAAIVGRRQPWVANVLPPVTVVLATLDSPEVVEARVRDLLSADYPADRLDVVVALDRKGAMRPHSFGDLDPRVHVVEGDEPGGKAATLNAGVRAATGSTLVFTDAAQRFDPPTIRRLVDALADPALGAVSGALQIGRDGVPATLAERYWILERRLRAAEARLHSAVGVTGAVYAMRRECWDPLPAGVILDDVYGPMHLVLRGYRVGFEPTATAYDDRRFPPGQEFRRKARTLTGVLQLCAWLPAVLVPWRNPIWLQFLFHKLLRLVTPYLLVMGALAGAAWLASGGAGLSPWAGTGVLVALLAVVLLAVATVPRLRRAASMAIAMQGAVLRATVNGLRGHWDVWSR